MARPDPLELPHYDMVSSLFTLDTGTATARHAKGKAGTDSQVRDPIWIAEFLTNSMEKVARKSFSARLAKLRFPGQTFLAWDASQRHPLNYPDGVPQILASTWDGTATILSLATPGQINVGGIPPGFALLEGDKVGIVEGGIYGLFQVDADCVANGSGNQAIKVLPLVDTRLFSSSGTAVLYRPKAKFSLDKSSVSEDGSYLDTPISFTGYQVLV